MSHIKNLIIKITKKLEVLIKQLKYKYKQTKNPNSSIKKRQIINIFKKYIHSQFKSSSFLVILSICTEPSFNLNLHSSTISFGALSTKFLLDNLLFKLSNSIVTFFKSLFNLSFNASIFTKS